MSERTDYQATQPKGRVITDITTRRWIYGIAVAVLPLLIAWGYLDEQTAAIVIGVIGAILVPGLAAIQPASQYPGKPDDGDRYRPTGYVSGV